MARRALYRNGWVVGTLVAFAIIIVFFASFRDDYQPMNELLVVGIPIGVVLGALVGLAVEDSGLSRKKRNTIALAVMAGFAIYFIVLVLYLMSRA
jgi:uncharacterized membrane protein AbrB (regulator of aidB expression)